MYYSRDPEESQRLLDRFLEHHPVLGIDEETCEIFGQERGRLRQRGRLIGDFDLLIAAASLRHNLTLLTNNRRHFEMVDGLQIVSA